MYVRTFHNVLLSLCISNQVTGFIELVETFRQIFFSARNPSTVNPNLESLSFAHTYLLLLHEDYPCELEVFSPGSGRAGGASHEGDKTQVFCALGCVRDASDMETAAILEAAKSLGIICVGANLGMSLNGMHVLNQAGESYDSVHLIRKNGGVH